MGVLSAVIGCGGTAGSFGSNGSTGGTNNGSIPFNLSDVVGNWSGSFSGSYSQTHGSTIGYSGTGSGALNLDGTATFTYTAFTNNPRIQLKRTFTGKVDGNGNFSGTTPEYDQYGNQIGTFNATGAVTEFDASDVQVQIVWLWPYSNGGTFQTSTESWTLKKQ